jgi:hypothetical protein
MHMRKSIWNPSPSEVGEVQVESWSRRRRQEKGFGGSVCLRVP